MAPFVFMVGMIIMKIKLLSELTCCEDYEIIWLYARPNRLPRGVSCLIVAVVYLPPGSDETCLREHLFESLKSAESSYANCGLNRLNTQSLEKHFQHKQLVRSPTRKDVQCNSRFSAHQHESVLCQTADFSPFGLFDHNTIMVIPKLKDNKRNVEKSIMKRDYRSSRNASMGRYLTEWDWEILFSSDERGKSEKMVERSETPQRYVYFRRYNNKENWY